MDRLIVQLEALVKALDADKKNAELEKLSEPEKELKYTKDKIKQIKKDIETRNSMKIGQERNLKSIYVRSDIQTLGNKVDEIEELLKKEKKMPEEKKKQIQDTIVLTRAYVSELTHLEDPRKLFSKDTIIEIKKNINPNVLKEFEDLEKGDHVIDQQLEQISHNVRVLGDMANTMSTELTKQEELINTTDGKTDVVLEKIETNNHMLKRILHTVRSPGRFIIDFICIVLILAIALYIYNYVTTH